MNEVEEEEKKMTDEEKQHRFLLNRVGTKPEVGHGVGHGLPVVKKVEKKIQKIDKSKQTKK